MKANGKRQLYTLAFSLVVVMLGYGMIIPIIPFYVEEMGAGGSELGLLVASYAAMRLVFGPIWGSLSDRVGRKPILMVGVFGYAITMFFFGLASQLWMLFAARILSGVLSSATAPTTMAYISDSTSEEDRGGGMGVMGAAVGLGTILGPALGGLLSAKSLATPFFVASGLSVLAVFLIYFILPESLDPSLRTTSARGNNRLRLSSLWMALKSPVGLLLLLAFLVTAGITLFFGIFGLYALERFQAGPTQVGIILMIMGFISALAQGFLSGPLSKRFGDNLVIKTSLILCAGAYLLMIPANTFITMLITMSLLMLVTALMTPALTSLTSKVTTLEQGLTMGLSNSFMSLGRIVGPLWGGIVFDLNFIYPFISGCIILIAGFGLSLLGLKGTKFVRIQKTERSEDYLTTDKL